MSFTHLHRHSEYSLLDGLGTAQHYSAEAARRGMEALAITDHGTMAGVLHHIDACTGIHDDSGVKKKFHEPLKAIVGMEAYFRPNAKVHAAENKEYYHLVLLAKNLTGFRTLLRLTTRSWQDENFYYKPTIDFEMLKEEHEGLIASTSCLSGYLPQMMLLEKPDSAKAYMEDMRGIFGDDMYMEIQPHDFDEQRQVNVEIVNMANSLGIPFVAAVDAHYPYEDWHDTHDALVMMNTGQSLSTRKEADAKGEDYMGFSGTTFYLMDDKELKTAFGKFHPNVPGAIVDEAIKNTKLIADMCDVYEPSRAPKIPRASSSLMEAEAIIREWCEEGLVRIGKAEDEVYRKRLEHELTTMREKRVFDYFVILGDVIRWAKTKLPMPVMKDGVPTYAKKQEKRPIRVGAGRGSAAGSLVSYLCKITSIDPIGHGLLFERFLNPSRSDYPDIDVDFQHNRRLEIKQYLAARWGADHVADIGAYQRFGSRAALQNSCRVFDVPYEEVMYVTNAFEDGTGEINLEGMREISPTLDAFADKYPDPWRHAVRLEGQVKAASKHAAGVVITNEPLADLVPLMRGSDGRPVTQWSERAEFPIISMWGFLKMDILGTDSLTVQATALELIQKRKRRIVDFENAEKFPIVADPYAGDERVIESFGHGGNLGIFQFESRGITGLLRDIKPTWFGDIVAANALFRPGPLESGMAFDYAARKNGKSPITYWHESLVPFMEETLGVMVYQEQIMQIVVALGDFTLAEADTVRKAMTKWQSTKIKTNVGRQEMQKLFEKFAIGCGEKGLAKAVTENIWNGILASSIYSFNKSHSAGYSMQSYQDGWLKEYHPLEFYASLMTWEAAKVPQIIREAQGRGMKILPPDINESEAGFALVGNAIRFGFEAIKHVGDAAVDEILKRRPFESFEDLNERVELRKLNSRVKIALMECGAFDCWGMRADWTDEAKSTAEKRLLGFVLTGAIAVTKFKALIEEYLECPTLAKLQTVGHDDMVNVAGEIMKVKEIQTKKGDAMGFIDIVWAGDEFGITLFPEQYEKFQPFLVEGNAVAVRGRFDSPRGSVKAENVCMLADLAERLKEEKRVAR